jgi:hypothetical protein
MGQTQTTHSEPDPERLHVEAVALLKQAVEVLALANVAVPDYSSGKNDSVRYKIQRTHAACAAWIAKNTS